MKISALQMKYLLHKDNMNIYINIHRKHANKNKYITFVTISHYVCVFYETKYSLLTIAWSTIL